MNFSKQLKKYRERHQLSQEALAEKIYVTRQTISKWENEKSYPDIHNLVALSILFNITLDELVKGDVEMMKKKIDVKTSDRYAWLMLLFLFLTMVSVGPAISYLDIKGAIIPFIFLVIGMFYALRLEQFKKQNDLKTYKEIVAFMENKDDRAVELERQKRNKKKDILSQGKIVLAFTIVSGIIAGVSVWLSFMFKGGF